ncbi:MAG TPA: diguanylate cyclase [Pararobbsia sp.]|nr:diguanylate cyclase [Pararobbsia sp.]
MKVIRTEASTPNLPLNAAPVVRALLIAITVGLLCYVSIELTEANERLAVIWPANGVVLGLLLTGQTRSWSRTIAWAWVGNVAANFAAGDPPLTACLLALTNSVEIAIAALGCRSSNVGRRHFGEPLWVLRFAISSIVVAPAIATFAATTVLYLAADAPPLTTFARWFPADALGIAMCAPVTMVLFGASDMRIASPARLLRIALSLAFVLATTTAVFVQSHSPLLYLIYLALGVAIFNAGFSGAVIGLGASMVIAIAFTIRGTGPFVMFTSTMPERIQQLQLFFAAALAFTYPLSSLQMQRQRLSDKLRVSEQRFRTLAEHASDVIIRLDASMRLTYVSPSVREIFGYEPDALIKMSKWSLVVPDDVPRVRGAFERVRASLGRETFNYRVQRVDGEEVWVETILRAVRVESDDDAADELIEFIGATRDITERKKVEQALEQTNARLSELAHRDGLTELYNRRFFDEALEREYRRARRDNAMEISLLMIDVDYFKQYNDVHGHQAGDECLKKVAVAIGRACKRPPDTPARYGGEEFAVILPNTSFDGAALLAERMRAQISALLLNDPHEPERRVTVSIGVASISPYYDTQDVLVRKADEALYRAKAFGRNRVWPSADDLHPGDGERMDEMSDSAPDAVELRKAEASAA